MAPDRRIHLLASAVVLSWAGLYIHNWAELGLRNLLRPENSGPAVVAAILFVVYRRRPDSRVVAALLFLVGILHLVGGAIITAIPFAFLPFVPPQTFSHYLAHVVYGAAQLPLIGAMAWQMRSP